MKVRCKNFAAAIPSASDGMNPRAICGFSALGHVGTTFRHIILDWRCNAPCHALYALVYALIVRLHPESELHVVFQGSINPWDLLVSIKQAKHVVTSCLATHVGPGVANWILLPEQVRSWVWSAFIWEANHTLSNVCSLVGLVVHKAPRSLPKRLRRSMANTGSSLKCWE